MARRSFLGLPDIDRGLFARFQASIDPAWVLTALAATGTASLRRRKFPAEQVIWLVLGMALFRDLPIVEIVDHLRLVLPDAGTTQIAASAVMQARSRLGDLPLAWLFEQCAGAWAGASANRHRWRGLALLGVDGTTVRVPDSEENRAHFGDQDGGGSHGNSGYPLVQIVTLMVLRSHLLFAVRFGPYRLGERRLARELFAEVPDDSLLLVDRNFMYAKDLFPLQSTGHNRHWLTRARKRTTWRLVKRLGPGDSLVEILVNRGARYQDPTLPERWLVRAIKYRRPGFREQKLLTSLLDSAQFPADEVRVLYHERWEIELGYDEVKTEMLEREETIRSKSPKGVAQELWGIALAYNLVRLEMERAADAAEVRPTELSFASCLRAIKMDLIKFVHVSPGKLSKSLAALRRELGGYVLPPRRSERLYPRAVKLKMSNYPRKRTVATHGRRSAK
jgi:hypothetical protein